MGDSDLKPGTKIRLDGKYSGEIRFKGPIDGRKGEWLGLEMNDTVGDNDGSVDGKSYFTTHDGCGVFLREGSGRVVSSETGSAKIPEEMLEHMKYLFKAFDTDDSGDINQEELYDAMQLLGQKATKKHVKHIFEEIDVDHNGTIDFHEFIDVMQVQWKGMDLGKAVKIMKKHEEEENRQNDAQLDLRPVKTLYANMCGIKLHLRYFGTGMNCLLLLVYGLASLAALYFLLWRDLFNQLLVLSLGGMSALFAVGVFSIHTHSWVTIKVYAVFMFFGAGAQVTMCCLYYYGTFSVSGAVVKVVMDEKCGTCLNDEGTSCNTVTLTGSLIGSPEVDYSDMPWYCCCGLNECFDYGAVLVEQSNCVDGCPYVSLDPDDDELSRARCLNQTDDRFDRVGGCLYTPAEPGIEPICSCSEFATSCDEAVCNAVDPTLQSSARSCNNRIGCTFTPRVRAQPNTCRKMSSSTNCGQYRNSEDLCEEAATCIFRPAEYGVEPDLDDDMTTANEFCRANADFASHFDLAIQGSTSRLGNERCFVKETDDVTEGSMGKCIQAFQKEEQEVYIILILAMSPLQLIAAYIGWVLPDLYFKAHHEKKEDEAMEEHAAKAFESESADNPVADNGGKEK